VLAFIEFHFRKPHYFSGETVTTANLFRFKQSAWTHADRAGIFVPREEITFRDGTERWGSNPGAHSHFPGLPVFGFVKKNLSGAKRRRNGRLARRECL
jgi:hypothetical protein